MATPRITGLSYNNGKPFVSGVSVVVGGSYTITAQVNAATRSVTYKRDGALVATDSAAPYAYVWKPTQIGAHSIVARPYPRANGSGSGGPSITVNCSVIAVPPPAVTTATVSWTQIANATGYRVFWGTVTNQYSYIQDVGNNFSYVVPDLKTGTPYYFSAKSYNATQLSAYATEVKYTP